MVRAVRLAATLDFAIEAATLAGIEANAALVAPPVRRAHRRRARQAAGRADALGRASADERHRPARPISPDLAAQRGIPQNKVPGEDLWDHTLRSVDAAPAARPVVRLAALLHDIGKPATFADGHFIGPRRCRCRARRSRSSTGSARRDPSAIGSSSSCATTCSATSRLVRRRRPAVHPEDGRDRGARGTVRPARGRQRGFRAAGRRGPAWTSCGRGSPPSCTPTSCWIGAGWRSMGPI